jgi:hypothetical protein
MCVVAERKIYILELEAFYSALLNYSKFLSGDAVHAS